MEKNDLMDKQMLNSLFQIGRLSVTEVSKKETCFISIEKGGMLYVGTDDTLFLVANACRTKLMLAALVCLSIMVFI